MNHTSEKFTTYLKNQLTRKQFGPNEWNFKPSTIISDIPAKATMVIAEEHECPQQCFFFFFFFCFPRPLISPEERGSAAIQKKGAEF